MGDIYNRPFSKNYSGLINQSVIAVGIAVICVTSQELMKRRRRGKQRDYAGVEGVGSVETWEFGYLFQGRSWARNPSPPAPRGWPLSWVKETILFPEDKMNELRGVDATLYVLFLRGCFWFTLLHTLTTLPILLPIHVRFSIGTVSPRSMTRASISSLVLTDKGLSLLWIHICLFFWVTFSWMAFLVWICHGAFRFRSQKIEVAMKQADNTEKNPQYHPHPHPQYPFEDIPILDPDHSNRGLKMRTVMVSNVPPQLRSEQELKEYFEYYMSRPLDKPAMGITSSTQPGFINKSVAFLFNRAKRLPAHIPHVAGQSRDGRSQNSHETNPELVHNSDAVPVVDKVIIARKMTELASLLERREEVLRRLETAHIKLAKKALLAVKSALDQRQSTRGEFMTRSSQISLPQRPKQPVSDSPKPDLERGDNHTGTLDDQERMDTLIQELSPFVTEFGLNNTHHPFAKQGRHVFKKIHLPYPQSSANRSASLRPREGRTIWEALLSVPRYTLDPYQPLVHLSALFRGKTVPSIDYYTAKLGLLTSLITENRSKAVTDYEPVSTAFVTFADPHDARRACKYLAVHPNNPMTCLVSMAPAYEDLDWIRVMKATFRVEFVKDWVVSIGVWAFTVFWLFPVSLLVGLVSIQSIGDFWPGLKSYLDRHPWEEELIQSFLPTLLVALLAILIPLVLLLIAKKAHTIPTLSSLHDRIMTRYYKFLVVNVLVFFCVGTAALQSFLLSFRNTSKEDLLKVVADSFPTAGPFYVGWLIFTTAIHGGFELALLGLPLIMYPSTSRQVTPRKRAVGIRPRTFNFYYWLPNHLLVIHVMLLFSVLNPLVIPFSLLYFSVESVVVKNQLLHVYAKNYEGNGQLILIRLVRYSLDGLLLAQAVFLAYMVVLKKSVNVGLAAVLIVLTAVVKLSMTRICRVQFERDDVAEAEVVCHTNGGHDNTSSTFTGDEGSMSVNEDTRLSRRSTKFWTWKVPRWINFSYSTVARRKYRLQCRQSDPFGPQRPVFSRLSSLEGVEDTPCQKNDNPAKLFDTPSHTSPVTELDQLNGFSVVTLHPPPVAWDDESHTDLVYDNPYYTRPINNLLWLPRNPLGILSLDDTVDLSQAVTSEPGAGQLGTWFKHSGPNSPPLPMSVGSAASIGSPEEESTPKLSHTPTPVFHFTGDEDIDLPAAIRTRVQSIENEDDVEHSLTRRPSVFNRNRGTSNAGESVTGSFRKQPSLRRPTSTENQPCNFRSFSSGSQGTRKRTTSFLSTDDPRQRARSVSVEQDPAARPDTHAQAGLARVASSMINASVPELASGSAVRVRPNNITTQEAVVHEVIAEEQKVAEERLRQEQAEAEQAQSTKSWLTSWMFSKGRHE